MKINVYLKKKEEVVRGFGGVGKNDIDKVEAENKKITLQNEIIATFIGYALNDLIEKKYLISDSPIIIGGNIVGHTFIVNNGATLSSIRNVFDKFLIAYEVLLVKCLKDIDLTSFGIGFTVQIDDCIGNYRYLFEMLEMDGIEGSFLRYIPDSRVTSDKCMSQERYLRYVNHFDVKKGVMIDD